MAESARVSSIQDLQDFRGFLVKFAEGVQHGLATADAEVQSTGRWLKDEHPARLGAAHRKAQRDLELALDELRRKRLQPTATGDPPSVAQEQKVVNQAKAKLQWVEERVAATRRWARQFDRDADGYRSSTQAARAVADALAPRALARLEAHLRALENYLQNDRPPDAAISRHAARGGDSQQHGTAPDQAESTHHTPTPDDDPRSGSTEPAPPSDDERKESGT